MMTAPNAGPTNWARLNKMDPMPIAEGRSFRGTRLGAMAKRTGDHSASKKPAKPIRTISRSMVMKSRMVRTARIAARPIRKTCAIRPSNSRS